MSSSSAILFLNPPIHHHKPPLQSSSSQKLWFNSHLCFSASSNNSSHSSQEQHWLREEQRWLREEQRWLREEQRWARERDSLLRQISDLQFRIQALEHQLSVLRREAASPSSSVSETISCIAGLLQVLKEKSLIAETGSSAGPMVLEDRNEEKEEDVVVEKVIKVSDEEGNKVETKKRSSLRKGSEGEEVRAMQEALQQLGFYSGEEDMEFSVFSTGTERAVKTWQASLGSPEDGIMTEQLLERLYVNQIGGSGSKIKTDEKDNPTDASEEGANGAAVASFTEISKVQQRVVKDDEGVTGVDLSEHRVFLIGENRWEEPSRLGREKNTTGESKEKKSTTKCRTCRGEGRLMCTECDGTGEPNIEPQFLEWVDEGAKCPYCEGLGYIICDVCEGKTAV